MLSALGPLIQNDKLESVQRRSARFAMKNYHPTSSVTEMINKLRLNHHRDTIRLQMMYKIIYQIVDLKLPDYITFNHGITRGHDYKLTVPLSRIDSNKFSYFLAIITIWNNYPMKLSTLLLMCLLTQ